MPPVYQISAYAFCYVVFHPRSFHFLPLLRSRRTQCPLGVLVQDPRRVSHGLWMQMPPTLRRQRIPIKKLIFDRFERLLFFLTEKGGGIGNGFGIGRKYPVGRLELIPFYDKAPPVPPRPPLNFGNPPPSKAPIVGLSRSVVRNSFI